MLQNKKMQRQRECHSRDAAFSNTTPKSFQSISSKKSKMAVARIHSGGKNINAKVSKAMFVIFLTPCWYKKEKHCTIQSNENAENEATK